MNVDQFRVLLVLGLTLFVVQELLGVRLNVHVYVTLRVVQVAMCGIKQIVGVFVQIRTVCNLLWLRRRQKFRGIHLIWF